MVVFILADTHQVLFPDLSTHLENPLLLLD